MRANDARPRERSTYGETQFHEPSWLDRYHGGARLLPEVSPKYDLQTYFGLMPAHGSLSRDNLLNRLHKRARVRLRTYDYNRAALVGRHRQPTRAPLTT